MWAQQTVLQPPLQPDARSLPSSGPAGPSPCGPPAPSVGEGVLVQPRGGPGLGSPRRGQGLAERRWARPAGGGRTWLGCRRRRSGGDARGRLAAQPAGRGLRAACDRDRGPAPARRAEGGKAGRRAAGRRAGLAAGRRPGRRPGAPPAQPGAGHSWGSGGLREGHGAP